MRGLSMRLGMICLATVVSSCSGEKAALFQNDDGTGGQDGSGGSSVSGSGGGFSFPGTGDASVNSGGKGTTEPDGSCPSCVPTDICSDGTVSGSEQCDDG